MVVSMTVLCAVLGQCSPWALHLLGACQRGRLPPFGSWWYLPVILLPGWASSHMALEPCLCYFCPVSVELASVSGAGSRLWGWLGEWPFFFQSCGHPFGRICAWVLASGQQASLFSLPGLGRKWAEAPHRVVSSCPSSSLEASFLPLASGKPHPQNSVNMSGVMLMLLFDACPPT